MIADPKSLADEDPFDPQQKWIGLLCRRSVVDGQVLWRIQGPVGLISTIEPPDGKPWPQLGLSDTTFWEAFEKWYDAMRAFYGDGWFEKP
jgi:hypothetical protein